MSVLLIAWPSDRGDGAQAIRGIRSYASFLPEGRTDPDYWRARNVRIFWPLSFNANACRIARAEDGKWVTSLAAQGFLVNTNNEALLLKIHEDFAVTTASMLGDGARQRLFQRVVGEFPTTAGLAEVAPQQLLERLQVRQPGSAAAPTIPITAASGDLSQLTTAALVNPFIFELRTGDDLLNAVESSRDENDPISALREIVRLSLAPGGHLEIWPVANDGQEMVKRLIGRLEQLEMPIDCLMRRLLIGGPAPAWRRLLVLQSLRVRFELPVDSNQWTCRADDALSGNEKFLLRKFDLAAEACSEIKVRAAPEGVVLAADVNQNLGFKCDDAAQGDLGRTLMLYSTTQGHQADISRLLADALMDLPVADSKLHLGFLTITPDTTFGGVQPLFHEIGSRLVPFKTLVQLPQESRSEALPDWIDLAGPCLHWFGVLLLRHLLAREPAPVPPVRMIQGWQSDWVKARLFGKLVVPLPIESAPFSDWFTLGTSILGSPLGASAIAQRPTFEFVVEP